MELKQRELIFFENIVFSFRSPKREEISNYLSATPQFRIAEDDPGDYQREQKSPLRIFWEERGILVEKNELKERKGDCCGEAYQYFSEVLRL